MRALFLSPLRHRQTHRRVGAHGSPLRELLFLQTASRIEIKGKWIETTVVLTLQCNFQSNKHSGFPEERRKRAVEWMETTTTAAAKNCFDI